MKKHTLKHLKRFYELELGFDVPPKNAMRGKIHLAKNKLAIDDNTYQEMLQNLTDKTSCKDLNFTELSEVIKHLENCGLNLEQPKINKIYSFWSELQEKKLVKSKNLTACRSYVQKQAQKNIYDCTTPNYPTS